MIRLLGKVHWFGGYIDAMIDRFSPTIVAHREWHCHQSKLRGWKVKVLAYRRIVLGTNLSSDQRLVVFYSRRESIPPNISHIDTAARVWPTSFHVFIHFVHAFHARSRFSCHSYFVYRLLRVISDAARSTASWAHNHQTR